MSARLRFTDRRARGLRRGQASLPYVQHGRSKIDPDQVRRRRAVTPHLHHDSSSPTGHIEDRLGRMACHPSGQTPAPVLIQASANDRVGQIVALSNAAKHAAQPLWGHASEHVMPLQQRGKARTVKFSAV